MIPRGIREAMRLRSGDKVQVIAYRNRIEIVPVRNLRNLRGFLKGMDTSVARDPDRA